MPGLEDIIMTLLIIAALSIYDIEYLFLGSQLLALGLTVILFLQQRLMMDRKTGTY